MSWSILLLIVLFNTLVAGLVYYFTARRGSDNSQVGETRRRLGDLHKLTCDVAQRVEKNVRGLDEMLRRLRKSNSSKECLSDFTQQQMAFSEFLRDSAAKFGQLGGQIQSQEKADAPLVAVRKEAERVDPPSDRRETFRKTLSFPLVILPLDLAMDPIGEAVESVTREVSKGGISFFHENPFPLRTEYFAAVLRPVGLPEISVVIVQKHTSRISKGYVSGGEFWYRFQGNSAAGSILKGLFPKEVGTTQEVAILQ